MICLDLEDIPIDIGAIGASDPAAVLSLHMTQAMSMLIPFATPPVKYPLFPYGPRTERSCALVFPRVGQV